MRSTPEHAMATVQEYLDLSPGGPHYQLIEGELRMAPAPNRKHQRILRRLGNRLCDHAEYNQLGEVFYAPFDVFLTDFNVFQPDLLFVAEARKGLVSMRGVEGPPDLVVEILSPSTAKEDLGPKKHVYAATGVSEYWIIDPDANAVAVYFPSRSIDEPAKILRPGEWLTSDFFPGLEIDLQRILAE